MARRSDAARSASAAARTTSAAASAARAGRRGEARILPDNTVQFKKEDSTRSVHEDGNEEYELIECNSQPSTTCRISPENDEKSLSSIHLEYENFINFINCTADSSKCEKDSSFIDDLPGQVVQATVRGNLAEYPDRHAAAAVVAAVAAAAAAAAATRDPRRHCAGSASPGSAAAIRQAAPGWLR